MKPEIVRIKEIYKKESTKIYCLFTNNEHRFINFSNLFKLWNITDKDIEYKLLDINQLHNASIRNGTLCWENIEIKLLDDKNNENNHPYDIDPIVLYQNSEFDNEKLIENIGVLIKNERKKSGLTKKQLAKKSGISEDYISKIENEMSNIELLMIRDIIKSGFGKKLKITIE